MGLQRPRLTLYSWSKFGREAEYIAALYLKSIGWDVRLSPASRGPGRHCCQLRQFKMVYTRKGKLGYTSAEGLRSEKADGTCKKQRRPTGGTTFQPFCGGFSTGNYSILFYVLDSWQAIEPTKFEARREHIAWRPSARFP